MLKDDYSSGLPRTLAPIALFVYNRAEHTQRTLEALRANDLARRSQLYVFADGPRHGSVIQSVKRVRNLFRGIHGFQSVTLIERDVNLGLATSVISGVTHLCNEFGRAIVVEDDVVTSVDFLNFMNSALERYENELRVFSVSGFNFAVRVPESYPFEAYFAYRSSSWGWGTWRDRWERADWQVRDFDRFRRDKHTQRAFNRGGQDLSDMLIAQMLGETDSWAIRWAYTHFLSDAASLLSTVPKVYNIGLDASGVHCRRPPFQQHPLQTVPERQYRFPDIVNLDPDFVRQIQKKNRRSVVWRVAKHIRRMLPAARSKSIASLAGRRFALEERQERNQ